jgi:hypothetical protein
MDTIERGITKLSVIRGSTVGNPDTDPFGIEIYFIYSRRHYYVTFRPYSLIP